MRKKDTQSMLRESKFKRATTEPYLTVQYYPLNNTPSTTVD